MLREHGQKADLSEEMRRLLHAFGFSMVGHLVWSRTSPRYVKESGFSERQLRWMRDGTEGEGGVMG